MKYKKKKKINVITLFLNVFTKKGVKKLNILLLLSIIKYFFSFKVSFDLKKKKNILLFVFIYLNSIFNYKFNKQVLNIQHFVYYNPIFILFLSLENLKPKIRLKTKVVKGRINKIPYIIENNFELKLILNWYSKLVSTQNIKGLEYKILIELVKIYKKKSTLYKLRETLYTTVLKNRALIRFLKK